MQLARRFLVSLAMAIGITGGVAWAGWRYTVHDSDGNDNGTVNVSSKNGNNTDAGWKLSGSVEYSAADGGGGSTDFTFTPSQDAFFAEFTRSVGYVDADVAAKAVFYSVNLSTWAETELFSDYFLRGTIGVFPETRALLGLENAIHVADGYAARYQVVAGDWPAAPLPFNVLGNARTRNF